MKWMGRRTLIRASILGTLMAATLLIPIESSAACVGSMSSHGQVFLDSFQGGAFAGSRFYSAQEGSPATAFVRSTTSCFDNESLGQGRTAVKGEYVTDDGSATAPADYVDQDGETGIICNDAHPAGCDHPTPGPNAQQQPVTLPTVENPDQETAVEAFAFRLNGWQVLSGMGGAGGIAAPSSAPVYIVDDDGAPRASLEPGVAGYSQSETFAQVRVPVFLAGTGGSTVGFTITPDSAAPAMPGQDFTASASPVSTTGGVGFIDIGVVNDKLGESPESLIITLTGTVDGPGTTKVTILDNEESVAPSSNFHHPRQGWRYKKSDYRIREFHVFTSDNPGGSGVVAAEIALRKNMKSGDCIWRTPGGWEKKDCMNRVWLPTSYDATGELYRLPMKQLKSSVRTKIKDYTAFSRAIDGAENVENQFDQKRNANTFEIKRVRRR